MRNLLAFIGAVVVTVGGIGWYLGWYQLHTAPAPDGHRGVNIDFDTKKIGADIQRGGRKLHDLVDKAAPDPKAPADAKGGDKARGPGSAAPKGFGGGEEAEH